MWTVVDFGRFRKNRDSDLPNAIYRCVNGYRAAYNGKSLGVFKTLKPLRNKRKQNEYI